MPITARIGVKEVGLRRRIRTLEPSMSPRLKSHAVTVVPTFAPIITLIDWRSVISPEFTKPTTITVVAEELWITAVTPRPVRKPAMGFPVILSSRERSFPPARRSSACPIRLMPKRNSARPPSIVSVSKMSINYPFPDICFTKSA